MLGSRDRSYRLYALLCPLWLDVYTYKPMIASVRFDGGQADAKRLRIIDNRPFGKVKGANSAEQTAESVVLDRVSSERDPPAQPHRDPLLAQSTAESAKASVSRVLKGVRALGLVQEVPGLIPFGLR
jgi:hypothetical protein